MTGSFSPDTADVLARMNQAVAEMLRDKFTPAEEALADEAMLSLHRLQQSLFARGANSAACRVDELLCELETFARRSV